MEKETMENWTQQLSTGINIFIMKIGIIILITTFYMCSPPFEKHCITTSTLRVCKNNKNDLVYYFNNKNELIYLREAGMLFYFYNGNINMIKKIEKIDVNTHLAIAQVNFLENYVKTSVKYSDSCNKETIIESIFDKYIQTKVLQLLPRGINKRVVTAYYKIDNKKDTLDYFFYKKNTLGNVTIYTDVNGFDINEVDSILLEYLINFKDISFSSPEEHTYLPNFENRETIVLKNSLKFQTDTDTIIGTLWGFKNNISRTNYSYQLIYLKGDLMNRITNYHKNNELINSFEGKTINNTKLVEKILASNYYKIDEKSNTLILR